MTTVESELPDVPASPVPAESDEGASDDLGELVTPPPSFDEIETWWTGLSPATQDDLIAESPELIGNLDGIDFDLRDRVNRGLLDSTIATLEASLESGMGKAAAGSITQRLDMLREIDESLERPTGSPERRLISLDTTFPGKAAVAIGEIERADFISILVPGALLSVRAHMSEWTKVASDLYQSQEAWQTTFSDPRSVATVSWIGYQTPDVTNAVSLDLAEQGAEMLAGFVNGLKALRADHEPYISVFAHSYGATATTLALSRGTMTIDALAMIGSPGGDVSNVSQLGIAGDKVWVGEAPWDPIVNTAFFGVDPSAPSFGAHRMNVSGSSDPVTGAVLTASVGHDWYLEPGTESLRNLALIGIDRGEFVTDGSDDDQLKTLALLDR
ncbi:alpha/beta hydrolase [Amnibacterium flavum]|uniref:alpha/beta hydrolase n=1 Tax=Amnibacterium flavum TaxID=2173173 RepID=UPI00140412B7|nr:alpha/beta hydrolase [Amnibacterium flavum]